MKKKIRDEGANNYYNGSFLPVLGKYLCRSIALIISSTLNNLTIDKIKRIKVIENPFNPENE